MTRRSLLLSLPVLQAQNTEPVLMDHDGGMPDDYAALALLLAMKNVELLGVTVLPADSYLEPAVSATQKILAKAGKPDVGVWAGDRKGVHPFPSEWRESSRQMEKLPILAGTSRRDVGLLKAPHFIAQALRTASKPVTILATGPLTNIAEALSIINPDIEKGIKRIVWMGGALKVKGNVEEKGHNGSAEWNAYWDPGAAARVWKSSLPIVMCPLDCTNHVPVTKALVQKWAAGKTFFSRLASQAYAPVAGNPDLYLWDVLTTVYLAHPEYFKASTVRTEIVIDNPEAGRTRISERGRPVTVLESVDLERLHQYLYEV